MSLPKVNSSQAFSVTEDQMEKAALMLSRSEDTEKLGKFVGLSSKESTKMRM